jgi:hypothetical protein
MRDPALAVFFSLALVYAAQAQEYPPGLFERSPLVKPQGGPGTGVGYRSRATQNPASEAPNGSCKHYREWFYPWSQPCQRTQEQASGNTRSHTTQNLASEAPKGSCKHYREWFYPWPQPC